LHQEDLRGAGRGQVDPEAQKEEGSARIAQLRAMLANGGK
jgi:hypothetical protein